MSALDAIINPKLAADGLRPQDGVEDMTHISAIDVDGINTNLRVRFNRDDIYTYTGTILVAVNPYKRLPYYERETMERYHGKAMGDAPPHVFAIAEAAFSNVKTSDVNQSCLISGESGAGKTETTKFILQYLCASSSNESSTWVERIEQQILQSNVVLEAFGNAKTIRNDNSSRFGKFIQVCFDENCEIRGSIIQEYLLEQSRIVNVSPDERNYHVFYQLLSGGDPSEYLLDKPESYFYLNQSSCYTLADISDADMYEELRLAMGVLNIEADFIDGIFSIVSAVLHIGNFSFKDIDGESVALTDKDRETARKVSTLLGIKQGEVEDVLRERSIVVRGNTTTIPLKIGEAHENKHAMAKALYSRTFAWLVDKINNSTNPGDFTAKFIGVLDIFGFENFGTNSFEQLCINFTNEKLHKFFNHYVFQLEQAEYEREEIEYSHITFTDNSECLELIEKPPKCILRLLDEECRFPKGTDETYLQKQHAALEAHPYYVKGADKTKWDREFGVKHFAGDVNYSIHGFLDKNKDVTQDTLFHYMAQSSKAFVKDLCRFQDLLQVERKVIFGKKLRRTKSVMKGRETMRTNKSKPTVGDTFRRQLQTLIDILEATTPWYVRCIKPNAEKAARKYDDTLVVTQLNYSGMLDIVRIRKQGFPVHVPAEKFVEKYFAMARVMGKTLSKDPRAAVKEIMTYIKAPETEWQVGKTKVFLRNSVFEPLQARLQELIHSRILEIQAWLRGTLARAEFQRKRRAIVYLQSKYRGARQRIAFLHKRRAIVTIQAYTRGFFAREVVKEIRRKRAEEAARLKREREEKERRRLQEEGEAIMEQNVEEAARELLALTRQAEAQLRADKKPGSTAVNNLDGLFKSKTKTLSKKKAKSYLSQMSSEMDALLAGKVPTTTTNTTTTATNASSTSETAPPGSLVKQPGARTMRRRERAQKRIDEDNVGVATSAKGPAAEVSFNPKDYPMVQYAKSYFADHPKGGSGTLGRSKSLRRGQKAVTDPLPKEEMVVYTKHTSLPTSLVKLHNPENMELACSIWKDLNKQLRGELKETSMNQSTQSIIAYCLDREELRDEVYCQIIRQVSNNPSPDQQSRGWQLLAILAVCFSPSKALFRYVLSFMMTHVQDAVIGKTAAWSLDALKRTRYHDHNRRAPPSLLEMDSVRKLQPIVCRIYFLDSKCKAVGLHPCSTAVEVIKELAEKIGLSSYEGWSLFESTKGSEHFVRGTEFVADILSDWEKADLASVQMSKYQTTSRRRKSKEVTEAIGGGADARFVFRKRLFLNPQEPPKDPTEYSLLYAQAVHSVVSVDEFPVNEKVALQLAGLQAQVLWGRYEDNALSRYEEVETYLAARIRHASTAKTKEQWAQEIAKAHKDYGREMTTKEAQVLYLTAVKQFPLYGGTFFVADFKSHWSFPNTLFVTVHHDGFRFVSMKTKEVLASFAYAELESVQVSKEDNVITLKLTKASTFNLRTLDFFTTRCEDIAHLIASYSRPHRNWKYVNSAVARQSHHVASTDEKERIRKLVLVARAKLAASRLLLMPQEGGRRLLGNTLRRRKDKAGKSEKELEFEKMYPVKYWSYSKHKLSQPITQVSPDAEEVVLNTFNSLLVYAGLLSTGGYHHDGDHEHILLIQSVLQKCLEMEDVCNEFYLQLIKQTTDQPDANSKINVLNWQFFAIALCVVVPRHKELLQYIQIHLRKCSQNPESEEGKYALFCQKCLARTVKTKNRKYPPSRQEILCVSRMRPIHARFHFMDGEFRALMFDSADTTQDVVRLIKERLGLGDAAKGFSLFEVFGSLERHMLPYEKVADAIYKWEKYALSTNSRHELKLTFKKRLFTGPFGVPKNPIEFDLLFHQAVHDVKSDRFPMTPKEAAFLLALRAQVELRSSDATQPPSTLYNEVMTKYLPKHLLEVVQPEDIAEHHAKLAKKSDLECNRAFLQFVQAWPLYGCTIFEVMQSYTKTLPKTLWLAVDEKGFHLLKRRARDPLVSYSYKNIGSYSPSLRNLMIVTGSLTRGTKFMFNTTQASQIAHLMRDYTSVILSRRGAGK